MSCRILAISNHGEMIGGGEHSFLGLVSQLPASCKSLALTPHSGELSSLLSSMNVSNNILPLPPIRVHLINKMAETISQCLSICRKFRPDIIYANGSRACFYGGITGRLLGVPVVWHCRIALKDPRFDFFLKSLSTIIIVNSYATGKRFSPSNKKVRVIYNGIDIDRFAGEKHDLSLNIPAQWKVLLCVARCSRWKRHDRIIDAFEIIARVDPRVHLFCVGGQDHAEPEWWRYLQERTRQSSVSERIHWVGYTSEPLPWYRRADVFILASEDEPFGRVIIEAMASGVPVVAVKGGGVSEIIRSGVDGLLVHSDQPLEMAAAVRKLVDDPVFRNTIVDNASTRALAFNLKMHVKNVAALFEEVSQM